MRILFLFFLLLSSIKSIACTCRTLDKITIDELENVGEAFVGTIKTIVENDSNHTVAATFEIIKYLKGKIHKSEITVITNSSGASCGLNFEKGQKWYVFAHYSNNQLYSDLCSRSAQLNKVSAKAKRLFIGRKNYRKDKLRYRQDKKSIKKYLNENATNSKP
jgi:hypothetical protein